MTTTAIASTQKAGEGDATILGNNSRPIAENLLKYAAQDSKQKAQDDLLKSKQTQENQTNFFKGLSGLKDKIAFQDVGAITKDVNDMIDYAVDAQKNGQSPFDPSNPTYLELYRKLSNISEKSSASKSAQTIGNNFVTTWQSGQKGDFDQMANNQKLADFWNTPIMERNPDQLKLTYAPINAVGILDKTFSDNLKSQFTVAKTYNDKGLTQEANDVIDVIKKSTIPAARLMLDKYVVQGRMTPEDADKTAQTYVEQYQQKALFDPTKNNELEQKTKYNNEQIALGKERNNIAWYRAKIYKSNADLQQIKNNFTGDVDDPTGVTTWAYDLNNGNEKAIQRLNTFQMPSINLADKGVPKVATSNKDAKIVQGSDISQDYIDKTGLVVDPSKKYISMSFSDAVATHNGVATNHVFIEMDDKNPNVESIVNSPLGQIYNRQVIKKENTPYTNPEYAATKHKSSNTTTTTTKTANKSGSSGSSTTVNKSDTPSATRGEWKKAGWNDSQIDLAVKNGKIKLK